MALHSLFICVLLTLSISFPQISSTVNYEVFNEVPESPGGIVFVNKIGIPYTKQIMATINEYIWSTVFQQNNPTDRKPVPSVKVYINDYKGGGSTTWGKNKINISAFVLEKYTGDVKWLFTSTMYHEMTHVFQWNGEGHTPIGLVEGIADYTCMKANYTSSFFAKPGAGESWDQKSDVTARFLEYCDQVTPGFVAKLNKMMRFSYQAFYFKDITGKPMDQLWKEYKAKYEQNEIDT